MRIGILTFHRSFNYGAFMQCFSLSSRLKKEFPNAEIEIVDYSSANALKGYDTEISNADKKTAELLKIRNDSFLSCQQSLPLSDNKIVSDDMSDIVGYLNEHYQAIVVGSDAVWNWTARKFPNVYFLKDYKGLKFSYAASAHGMTYQNMSEEQKSYLKESFSDFTYIGARDITTENMVYYAAPDVVTHHNCDPTMFLNLSDVPCDMDALKKKMLAHGVDFSKPLIGLMAGNGIGRELKKHYGNSIQFVSLYQPNRYADVYLHDLTPYEWAHVFSFFKMTITHFFHGTMLSLVNHVPVIPIEYSTEFSTRNFTKIRDLMTRLELMDWYNEVNLYKENFTHKVLRKLHFPVNKVVWEKVFSLVDEFLQCDYSTVIERKVKKEADSAISFLEVLSKHIN